MSTPDDRAAARPPVSQVTDLPAFFVRTAEGFLPTGLGQSVWSDDTVGGVAVGSLLATLLDEACADGEMHVARLTVDILGRIPKQLLQGRVATVRDGRQMQLVAAELLADGRVAARATALRVRKAPTPSVATASPYPAPLTVPEARFMMESFCGDAIRTRPVRGALDEAGPGCIWARFDLEAVAGVPLSPLARAVIIADCGNGVGSPFPQLPFSCANLDIGVNFLRMPRGEWVLIDAQTESAGEGYAVVRNTFADAEGIYAYGAQTLFIAPAA